MLDRLLISWFFLTVGALGLFPWELVRTPIPWGARMGWVLVAVLFGLLGLLTFLFSGSLVVRMAPPHLGV
jgi:hypothetical protein